MTPPPAQRLSPTSSPIDSSETIVAPATAPGRGALSVVRLSGGAAHDIGRAALHPWPATARTATLSRVRDLAGVVLDQVVAIRYDAPASFTGEDCVELITPRRRRRLRDSCRRDDRAWRSAGTSR